MKKTESSILRQRREKQFVAVAFKKKHRSKIPRRKRFQRSPVLVESSNLLFSNNNSGLSGFAEASSSSSCFPDEVSCTSSWISAGYVNLKKKPRSSRRKRKSEEIESEVAFGEGDQNFRQLENISEEECRSITRSCRRHKQNEKKIENEEVAEVELSESSCLESCCGIETRFLGKEDEFPERNLKLKTESVNGVREARERGGNADFGEISVSESCCIQSSTPHDALRRFSESLSTERDHGARNSNTIKKNESMLEVSCLDTVAEVRNQNLYPTVDDSLIKAAEEEDRRRLSEFSELSRVERNFVVSNSESNAEKKPKEFDCGIELTCLEDLSYEDDSYSSTQEMTISNVESQLFPSNSDGEFSDSWLDTDSPSDFSERSFGNSIESPCFSLFLQFKQEFSKRSSRSNGKASSRVEGGRPDEFILLRFEDEEEEENYKNLRQRERSQNLRHDYAEDYKSTTEYGELVIQQRLLMVNWIVEQSDTKELRSETMFLGVNLLDRFLSEGFFKQKKNLQVVGIACLTLATRIEENQPLNCIRQKFFHVGGAVYSSCEVVAMEWLVQEILNFRCFLPTTYNFLWFYMKAAKADAEVEKRAKHLAVLSMLDHRHLCFWPSTIAAGLVILASLAGNHDVSCQWVMETHVRTRNDDLPECIKSLEWLVNCVC